MTTSVVAVRGDQIVHTFTDVTQPAGLAAVGDPDSNTGRLFITGIDDGVLQIIEP